MGRARAGVLDGALRSVVTSGTRASTMGGIATLGGVAKATVYNHFRTKDDVWAALLAQEIDRASSVAQGAGDLTTSLRLLFDHLAQHPARATLAEREPDVLARLVAGAPADSRCRDHARVALTGFGVDAGDSEVALVLRTAASLLLAPGSAVERQGLAQLVARTPVREPAAGASE